MNTTLSNKVIDLDIDFADPWWLNNLGLTADTWPDFIINIIHHCLNHVCTWLNQAEISLVLTNDAAIQELNKAYRHQDKPTNVLSFNQYDQPLQPDDVKPGMPLMLGDIVVAWETITRESHEQHKTVDHHLTHMVVHSFLHLLGYDHIHPEAADQMESLEIKILQDLNIANPYHIMS